MTHTPRPWIAREGTTTGAEVMARTPRGREYVVARCAGKDREANARLIAAAPDLLEALRDAVSQIEALCSELDVPDSCRAALSRATSPTA